MANQPLANSCTHSNNAACTRNYSQKFMVYQTHCTKLAANPPTAAPTSTAAQQHNKRHSLQSKQRQALLLQKHDTHNLFLERSLTWIQPPFLEHYYALRDHTSQSSKHRQESSFKPCPRAVNLQNHHSNCIVPVVIGTHKCVPHHIAATYTQACSRQKQQILRECNPELGSRVVHTMHS
jgi:hypothetical protein